jgi:hypothetical protein
VTDRDVTIAIVVVVAAALVAIGFVLWLIW